MFKFNRVVVINEEKVADTIRAFDKLEINEYEFIELGLGQSGIWSVCFKANKKQFHKFISMVRVNYIAKR